MGDPRFVALAAAVMVALAVAWWARRRDRRGAIRARLDLTGIEGRVVFFSDATCARCDVVRARLEAIGVPFTEIGYDRDPEVHRQVGVTAVPLVVVRDATGAEERRFAGVVPRARLAAVIGRTIE
jgi:predicted DsbA family dithiol-disulfide isomerase